MGEMGGESSKWLALPCHITLHFSALKPNFHLSDHDVRLLRSSCKHLPSSRAEICVETLVSSANILTLLLIHLGKSLTKTKNSSGTNTDPCRTPLVTSIQSECSPLTSSLILHPCRMVGMVEVGAPISLDGVAFHPVCLCICLCYLHFAPESPYDGKMYYTFWYWLTRVVPDKVQRAIKWL